MIRSNWNKADKTLFLALLVFFIALWVHLMQPSNVFADGFLFCAEAALVGGIADWFAVTALFRKPLGFPYHTAILPRRRDSFIKASITMVQKEFFSRRKIFHHLEQLHLMPMLMEWLNKPETESKLTIRLVHYVRDYLLRQDARAQADVIATKLKAGLNQLEPEVFFALFGRWLKQTGKDKAFVAKVANYIKIRVATDKSQQEILKMLQQYEKEKAGGTLASFFLGLAQAVDLVNLEEAASLMQKQFVVMLDELATENSDLQQEVLALFYEKAAVLNQEPEFHQLVHELKDSLLDELPLAEAIDKMLLHLRTHFAEDKARSVDPLAEHLPAFRLRLEDIIRQEYRRTLQLIAKDDELRRSIGHFLYDLIARSALHAQTLIGVVVAKVLSRLTDEQLNRLVYDKVEPDLLWIRMNGSIVGSGIGLILFLILQLAKI